MLKIIHVLVHSIEYTWKAYQDSGKTPTDLGVNDRKGLGQDGLMSFCAHKVLFCSQLVFRFHDVNSFGNVSNSRKI